MSKLRAELKDNEGLDISHVCRWLGALSEKSINKKNGVLFISAEYKNGEFQQVYKNNRSGQCWQASEKFVALLNSVIYKQSNYSWFFSVNEFVGKHRKLEDLISIRGLYCEDMLINDASEINRIFKILPSYLATSSQTSDGNYKTQAIWLFTNTEKIETESDKNYWKNYLKMIAENFGVNIGGSNLNQIYRIHGTLNTKHKERYKVNQLLPSIDDETIKYYDSKQLRQWVLLEHIKRKKYYNETINKKLENIDYRTLENILCFQESINRFESISELEMSVSKWLVKAGFTESEIKIVIENGPILEQPRNKKKYDTALDNTIKKAFAQNEKNNITAVKSLESEIDEALAKRGRVPMLFFEWPKLFFQKGRIARVYIDKHTVFERNSMYEVTKDAGLLLFQMLALANDEGYYSDDAELFIMKYIGSFKQQRRLFEKLRKITFNCDTYYGQDYFMEGVKPIFKFIRRNKGKIEYQLGEEFRGLYQYKQRLKQLDTKVFDKLRKAKGRYTVQLYFFTAFHLYDNQYSKKYDDIKVFMDYLGINIKKESAFREYISRIRESFKELNGLNILPGNMRVEVNIGKDYSCLIQKTNYELPFEYEKEKGNTSAVAVE